MQAEWALLLEASTFEYLFSDEIQVVVRVDVVLECPLSLAVGTHCPLILSHQRFVSTASFTNHSGLQQL